MAKQKNGARFNLLLIGLLVWGTGFIFIYDNNKHAVEQQFIDSLKTKELQTTQLLDISFAYTLSIKKQLEASIALAQQEAKHPLISELTDYPQFNAFGLSGSESLNGQPYSAHLSGIGALSNINEEVLAEISAALHVDLTAPFSEKNHSFVWSYYQSKSGFLLLTPPLKIDSFQFNAEQYKKPYWLMSLPENNPERATLISDLYEDGVGQGLMVTISSPVYIGNQFKGIAALDVGLRQLYALVRADDGFHKDHADLLTQDGAFVFAEHAANSTGLTGYMQSAELPTYEFFEFDNRKWLVSNLVKNKFYVVYSLDKHQLAGLTLRSAGLGILVLTLFIANFYLIAFLYMAFNQTRRLSRFDRLSKLYNRMTHEELSNQLFDNKLPLSQPISILMADLDHFKRLNDTRGHHAGDSGIKLAASIIASVLRKTDIAGRFGGEEFIITMPDTTQAQAAEVAERIRAAIEADCLVEETPLTISIGIAESHALGVFEYQQLCKMADMALYQAKHKGRNCCVIYNHNSESAI